jgi:ubiquinone/menaquinone biosynthesis C-methylase UbiE
MISGALAELARCPDCRGRMSDDGEAFLCQQCGHRALKGPGYLDLRPSETFTEQTRYLDDALHRDARHETVSPPLLQAGVRQWMLARLLKPSRGDVIADLGCGSGRSIVWNHASGATIIGIDVAPYFAQEALERGDLVLGDLRRLPFADGAFDKAYALDVFEHLSRDALAAVLTEMARVLKPGGQVFAYSHVRKNSWPAGGLRAINRLARRLERLGLIDLRQERLRKADHVNPLADIPDLERVVGTAGFRIARIRYYTPLIGAFVENILMRVAERAMARRAERGSPAHGEDGASLRSAEGQGGSAAGVGQGGATLRAAEGQGGAAAGAGQGGAALRAAAGQEGSAARTGEEGAALRAADGAEEAALRAARTSAKRRLSVKGPLYYTLRAVTWVMTWDVRVLGRVRTGPFFVLLERAPEDDLA